MKHQQGIILILTLILLSAMTMIGIAAYSSSFLEEKISKNLAQVYTELNAGTALERELADAVNQFTLRPLPCCASVNVSPNPSYSPAYCISATSPPCNSNTRNIWTPFSTDPGSNTDPNWWRSYGTIVTGAQYPGLKGTVAYITEEICDEGSRSRNYKITAVQGLERNRVIPLFSRWVYTKLERAIDYFGNQGIDQFWTALTGSYPINQAWNHLTYRYPFDRPATAVFNAPENGVLKEIWVEYQPGALPWLQTNFNVTILGGVDGTKVYPPMLCPKTPNPGVPNTNGIQTAMGRCNLPTPYRVKRGQRIEIQMKNDYISFVHYNMQCDVTSGALALFWWQNYGCTWAGHPILYVPMTVRGEWGPTFCDDYQAPVTN